MDWKNILLHSAFLLYCANMLVGVAARFTRRKFGIAHHVLYFVVFASAIATMVLYPSVFLLCTLLNLAIMPLLKPITIWHPMAASLGLVGWIVFYVIH